MKAGWARALTVVFGIMIGLAASGLVLLAASQPRGQAVRLLPPPTTAPLLVHVTGAVARPGVYALSSDARVQDAIGLAGGMLAEANSQAVNLAARLKDGDRLVIPAILTQTQDLPPDPARSAGIPTSPPASPTPSFPIHLNTATLEELDSLPGIGPVTAQKIITYRDAHGPFAAIEAIQDVPGIGPATFEKIKDLITVEG
ncbi:MAG TPA: ComEA family DNA-binding protein [Anaerolineales bacterium]